jgi:hypothetical protein
MILDPKLAKQQLELLKVSREILTDEYVQKRDQAQANWMQAAEAEFHTTGKLPQYPSSPAYPSVGDVSARAADLHKAVQEGTLDQQFPNLSPRLQSVLSQLACPTNSETPAVDPRTPAVVASAWSLYPSDITLPETLTTPVLTASAPNSDTVASAADTSGLRGPELPSAPTLQFQPQPQLTVTAPLHHTVNATVTDLAPIQQLLARSCRGSQRQHPLIMRQALSGSLAAPGPVSSLPAHSPTPKETSNVQ